MSMDNQIVDIIAKALKVDRARVTPELSIGDIPEWDSVGNITLISALEENFHVEFPIEDLFDLTSVESIIQEVKRLK